MKKSITTLISAIFTLSAPVAAIAQSNAVRDLSQVADDLSSQTSSIGLFVMIVIALLGLISAISGLMKMRAHAEAPNDPSNKLSTAVMLMAIGACLVAFPALISSGVLTIFGDEGGVINSSGSSSYFNFQPLR